MYTVCASGLRIRMLGCVMASWATWESAARYWRMAMESVSEGEVTRICLARRLACVASLSSEEVERVVGE
jgi:hypothetical protein